MTGGSLLSVTGCLGLVSSLLTFSLFFNLVQHYGAAFGVPFMLPFAG